MKEKTGSRAGVAWLALALAITALTLSATSIEEEAASSAAMQNLSWGVLAVNPDKATYAAGEYALIAISVLGSSGRTVCDANISLQVTAPDGRKTFMTVGNGITATSECGIHGVTRLPDYYAAYQTGREGTYIINLTAATAAGARSVTDSFTAERKPDFIIERSGPTRIFPRASYTMNITIIARMDYDGVVVEQIPSSFGVKPQQRAAVIESGGMKELRWNVTLKKGKAFTLGYEFDAPDVSPGFYLLGPLKMGRFSEARQWQVASDDLTTKTFTFVFSNESWLNYTSSCTAGELKANFTAGDGNPSGSLNTTYSKATGGSVGCLNVWAWRGTWEDLGVPAGSTVSGVLGAYDYEVEKSTVTSAETGPLLLTSQGGAARATLLAAASATSAIAWTTRTGTEQTFADEASSTVIGLNLTGDIVSSGGGARIWELHEDNIAVTITYIPPPNNTIIIPLAGRNLSGSFLVNASINASGAAVIEKANLTIYNNTGNATGFIMMTRGAGTAGAGYWNATFSSSALRDGRYNLSVNGTDDGGRITISQNVSVVIDNTVPNVSVTEPSNLTNLSLQQITINASVNDSLTGVFNVSFRIYNSSTNATPWLAPSMAFGTISQGYWNFTIPNSTQLMNGYYNLTINATDFAGNQLVLNISSFNVSNPPIAFPEFREVIFPGSIFLNPGTTKFVECNASLEDEDGADNIYSVSSTLFDSSAVFSSPDDNNNHYTNDSCTPVQSLNKVRNFTCGFRLQYYANNASWTCNVTATDLEAHVNFSINSSLVNELLSVGATPGAIDYGNLSATETSAERSIEIANLGNVAANVTVRGFGGNGSYQLGAETLFPNISMSCESGNITIGNHRYSNTTGALFDGMINLSSNSTRIGNLTLAQRTNDNAPTPGQDLNTTFWRIRLPAGVAGLCNGTVAFQARVG